MGRSKVTPLKVVILSKTASNLWPCINAVRRHEPDLQIIVVDDGVDWAELKGRWVATLGTKIKADVCDGPCTIVCGQRPFVFARNANIGIREAGDADVILLNDDALLESDGGFRLMQQAAQQHPEYGIIGAVTNLTGQPLQRPQNVGLREVPHIAFVCVLIPWVTRKFMEGEQIRIEEGLNRPVTILEQPRWATSVITGGFLDERYCLDYGVDDRDYCEQVFQVGLKIGVHDGCYVDHGSLKSSFRGNPEAPGSFQRNLELFKKKWGLKEVR